MGDVEQTQGSVADHDEPIAHADPLPPPKGEPPAFDVASSEPITSEPTPPEELAASSAALHGEIEMVSKTQQVGQLSNAEEGLAHVLPRIVPISHGIEDFPRDSDWPSARPPAASEQPASEQPASEQPASERVTPCVTETLPNEESIRAATDRNLDVPLVEATAKGPIADEIVAETVASELSPEVPVADLVHAPIEPDLEPVPLPGIRLRSKPPPKPAGYSSEPAMAATALLPAELPTVPYTALPVAKSTSCSMPPMTNEVGRDQRLPKSKVPAVLWILSLGVAGFVGWAAAGSVSDRKLAAAAASASAAVHTAREAAIAETQAAIPPLPAYFDLSMPSGVRPMLEIVKAEPGKRTRAEAVALGRQWQDKRFEEYARFSAELRKNPQKLDDPKARTLALEFVRDRSTSRAMLEILSDLPSAHALDLLYEVWIGSKDRNETTQFAEALLLAKDVRKRASGPLELGLALREKPTDCSEIRKLVEQAIRDGDRRASNQLVTTAARQNCGPNGDRDCVKCLADPKDMRKAIRATAARPDPVP